MNIRPLGLCGCEEVVTVTKMERFTTGISPRALRLGLYLKRHTQYCPKEEPPGDPQDGAVLLLVARQELGSPGGGRSAEGSTVQLCVFLAGPGHLLQLVRAVGDAGLTGALPVGWGEAGRQQQALVLTARLLA